MTVSPKDIRFEAYSAPQERDWKVYAQRLELRIERMARLIELYAQQTNTRLEALE